MKFTSATNGDIDNYEMFSESAQSPDKIFMLSNLKQKKNVYCLLILYDVLYKYIIIKNNNDNFENLPTNMCIP